MWPETPICPMDNDFVFNCPGKRCVGILTNTGQIYRVKYQGQILKVKFQKQNLSNYVFDQSTFVFIYLIIIILIIKWGSAP